MSQNNLAESQNNSLPGNKQLPHPPKNQRRSHKRRSVPSSHPTKAKQDNSIKRLNHRKARSQCKNTFNNSQNTMSPLEPSHPTRVGPQRRNAAETQDKDPKTDFMNMMAVLKEQMNQYRKEIYKNTCNRWKESNNSRPESGNQINKENSNSGATGKAICRNSDRNCRGNPHQQNARDERSSDPTLLFFS